VRLNDGAQFGPRHDLLHRREENVALGCAPVLFKSGTLIGRRS